MEKVDTDPSVPPPPYPGVDAGVRYYPGSATSGPSVSAYPYSTGQPQTGYSQLQTGYQPSQTGYPHSQAGPGEYPATKNFPADDRSAVGFPQQPGYIPLPPTASSEPGATTKLVYHQQPVVTVVPPAVEKFSCQLIMGIIGFVLCMPLGLFAVILAFMAGSMAKTDRRKAHRLGIISYVLSITGISLMVLTILSIMIYAWSR